MFVLEAAPLAERSTRAGALEVTRWRRFRHDRAYVQVHGEHIGYRDLRSGAVHAFCEADGDLILRATAHLLKSSDARRVG